MALTQEQQQIANEWLIGRCHHRLPCPLCGEQRWGLGDIVVFPIADERGIPVQRPRPIPMRSPAPIPSTAALTLVCEQCGFLRFLAAERVGLAPPKAT